MESGSLAMNTSSAPDPRVQSDCSLAVLRRRAWAQSKDSTWPESEAESCGPKGPQQTQKDGEEQTTSGAPGQVPNNITSWLNECRTPIGASLDDQSASPSRGVLKNGCSFEDDLSLGAEANHLQSSDNTAESCFGLAAHQKRSQYKERTRSMNSTGSGKSSTVSSVSEVLEQSVEHPVETLLTLRVSELLDLYEEDPEEILLNLGFGREEPDLASKVPSRFFNNSSIARGIDIKVYLGAQLQRMEVENPNYALTMRRGRLDPICDAQHHIRLKKDKALCVWRYISPIKGRFRQIEVLTTVANEFFQLYSQVSGNPVQRISSKDQEGEAVEGAAEESSTPLKRTSSARNVAKLLKKTITKRNLLAAAAESPEAHTPNQQTELNGPAASDHTSTNGHAHTVPEPDSCSIDPDHQAETVNQKHMRKKDSCSLATVTEETNGDADESPEQSRTRPEANEERPAESADCQSANERTEEGPQVVKEEQEEKKNLTSTPEKPPPTLAPLQLAQLRTENADSFDMEEIQSNEDEAPPPRTSRAADLLRTVSQQSDSSGFAEDPSADSNSYLKVQESCDSCDSETTVTSHPSLDAATPLAMDQPAFVLPGGREEEAGPGVAAKADGRSSPRGEDKHDGSSEQFPQYIAHHLPRNRPMETQHDETQEEEGESGDRTDPEPEEEIMPAAEQEPQPETDNTQSQSGAEQDPHPELENMQSQSVAEQKLQSELQNTQNQSAEPELQHPQIQTDTAAEAPTEGVTADGVIAEADAQEEHAFLDDSGSLCPTLPPSSPVLCALMRAKQKHVTRGGHRGRRSIRLQRSSSLPSSFVSPSRVVSSVRILFGRGQASCTQPTYSFKYNQEAEGDEEEEDEEGEEEEGQTSCRSTLIINPSSSSDQPPRLPTEAPVPPKPIPRYLLPSVSSHQSSSPPPDWPPRSHARSWSTRSVPDLSSNLHRLGHFQQNISPNQSWNPGQTLFRYPNPNPTAQYLNPSPNPSPSFNPSPYLFSPNHPPLYPPSLDPYAGLPNLLHHQNLSHHSSLSSFYQPHPAIPQQGSLSNLHHPSNPTSPHHINLGSPYPGTPAMHHQGYNQLYGHQSPYHATPHGSPLASPYLGYHGYCTNPHLPYPHPVTHCPPVAPEHSHHLVFPPPPVPPPAPPPAPGFFPGLASALGPAHNLHPGLAPHAAPSPAPCQGPSSTEMQLRRVLHDIRGTVQSLGQNRGDTLDSFSEHRATNTNHQTLAEFQERKKSLSLFRSQMTDLEQSIVRQQALVYHHLSPSDRVEVEQLQSLRSAVREELRQLEQQLEDKLMELTHDTQHRDLHRESNVDSLSSASALRAMEPVSDLLREQLFLQSELNYVSHALSTATSSRSSSPVRGGGGGGGEKEGGMYRASINITPVPPPRPNTRNEEEEEEGKKDKEGAPEEPGAAGGVSMGSLQQLIREIRESVTQEVRQEIYSELLAAVSPRQSPLPGRQHPL